MCLKAMRKTTGTRLQCVAINFGGLVPDQSRCSSSYIGCLAVITPGLWGISITIESYGTVRQLETYIWIISILRIKANAAAFAFFMSMARITTGSGILVALKPFRAFSASIKFTGFNVLRHTNARYLASHTAATVVARVINTHWLPVTIVWVWGVASARGVMSVCCGARQAYSWEAEDDWSDQAIEQHGCEGVICVL